VRQNTKKSIREY